MLPRSPKIKLMIELLCNCTPTKNYLHGILEKMGIPEESVLDFAFRSGTWPGSVLVVTAQGTFTYPYGWDNDISEEYKAPEACRRCGRIERTGDFIVGDPWELEKHGTPGKTMVHATTSEALSLMSGANIEYTPILEADWGKSVAFHNKLKRARNENFR